MQRVPLGRLSVLLMDNQDFLEEGFQLSSRNAKNCQRKALNSPQGMLRVPRKALSSPWGMLKLPRGKLRSFFKQFLTFFEEN
jgi:hypothetical protein